jgi:hypothetical protein
MLNNLTASLEAIVVGVKDFGLRLAFTFARILLFPTPIIQDTKDDYVHRRALYPNAFLLACAIGQGFLGSVLATTRTENLISDMISSGLELKMTSFLLRTIGLFVIAIFCACVAACLFRISEKDARPRNATDIVTSAQRMIYYVVGGYSTVALLFTIIWLVIVAGGSDNPLDKLSEYWSFALFLFATYMGWFFAMTWYVLYRVLSEDGGQRPAWLTGKITALSLLVVLLSTANAALPYSAYERGGVLLRGEMLALEILPTETIRLSYLAENVGDSWVVINLAAPYQVAVEYQDGGMVPAETVRAADCDADTSAERFLLLDAGEASILVACITQPAFRRVVTGSDFHTIDRRDGIERRVAGQEVGLSVSIQITSQRKGRHRAKVPL